MLSFTTGKDLTRNRRGGTWLGASENGRVACLLNIIESRIKQKQSCKFEGRGFVVVDYLRGEQSGEDYIRSKAISKKKYHLYNLILMEPDVKTKGTPYKVIYFNNVEKKIVHLGGGIHGFGNSILSKPFLKVTEGKKKMSEILDKIGVNVNSEEAIVSSLMEMMQDKTQWYPDNALTTQCQGYSEDLIRGLSSIWFSLPLYNYVTR